MVGCFWIGRDEGSFRWNMEWVVGKREGRSVGELAWAQWFRCRGDVDISYFLHNK